MSDGPHRSLPLRRAWKKVCEIADGRAHALEEVVERIPVALAADANNEIGRGLLKSLRLILDPEQPELIDDARQRVSALRPQAASVMEIDLVDAVDDALRDGMSRTEAFQAAAEVVLEERVHAAKRSVVEHYLRKAPKARAAHVERRVTEAIARASDSLKSLATALATGSVRRAATKVLDRSGLDDGPAFA